MALLSSPERSWKTAPPSWRPYIYKTNLFTMFHNDWANNVTFKVHVIQLTELNSLITYFHYIHVKKNSPPTGGQVFSPIWTIFEHVRDINELMKTAPPTGGHAKNLTKFHENWAKKLIEKCPAHWRPYINKTNVLTNFHDDWANIVTSIVFTRKTAPLTGGHVFQRTGTTFEFNQHIIKANILINFELDHNIIGTNLLTKFHEDRKINVASRVFTNKYGQTDGRRTKTGHKSSPEQSGIQYDGLTDRQTDRRSTNHKSPSVSPT
ncbi:hypothetical protein DPMN_036851 [Dreissena polymorpha]|uniref:Uncharacterized protein n=1 Tax=Dreissena polymorpha TaxID=45954 RepID=A0A9D4RNI9_DREPO|nr:hypothetical protein DPMN_036851 [Dreissena polymorpha]